MRKYPFKKFLNKSIKNGLLILNFCVLNKTFFGLLIIIKSRKIKNA
jgi:hypothetical protein